jgi:hypothetical protein
VTTPPPAPERLWQQPNLQGNILEEADIGAFGDKQPKWTQDIIRVESQNIYNLTELGSTTKSRQFFQRLRNPTTDVHLAQELGLYWPKVPDQDQWHDRITGRFHSSLGYNRTEPHNSNVLLPGGVGVVTGPRLSPACVDKGADDTGLGRWSWTRLRGIHNQHTTIISAYRPCVPSMSTPGETTVHEQHSRYFGAESAGPRSLFLRDLATFVVKQQEKGDIIIIGMDVNEDVRSRHLKAYFDKIYMHEAILSSHPRLSPPATCIKNESRTPIDSIWCSKGIRPIAAGFLRFGQATPSDHRAVWADFLKSDLMGAAMSEFRPSVSSLRSDDPRDRTKYNQRSYKLLEAQKVPARLGHLAAIEEDPTPQEIAEYNSLLALNTEIRMDVKATLRHIFRGEQHWSPEWKASRLRLQLWGRVVAYRSRHITGKKVSLTQIRRLMHQTKIRDALNNSLIDSHIKLQAAKREHRDICKSAWTLRESHLDDLDAAKAQANGTSIPIEEKKRKTVERQRISGRNLRRIKKTTKTPVTKVFSTNDDSVRTEHVTKSEIEGAFVDENLSRFSQTNATPPMDDWITDRVGYCAELEGGQEILDGTFDIPATCDPYLILLINGMRMPEKVRQMEPISTNISTEDHKSGWRKQKERTASARSDLGFSDHISATYHTGMAEIDRLFRQIPYKLGFSPKRYQRITDFEIVKRAGVYDVELMRTIQLMVAAFNMNNKLTGLRSMARAEILQMIPEEQSGSRKKHQAILAALMKVLTMDLSRRRRLPMALCSNDAKSCYDRIVLWIAALCLLRVGVARSATDEMMLTLQKALHFINTAFGDSDLHYGLTSPPLQGAGQGNGAGPAIWALISAVLLSIMRQQGFGLNIVTVFSALSVVLAGYAFVDDTDIIHAAPGVYTKGEELVPQMQCVLDTWEGLLRATGGALRDDKSYWYLLDYIFRGGVWKYRSIEDMPGDIDVNVVDRRGAPLPAREVLGRLEPSEARQTLGVYIAMDGNWRKQIEELKEKAVEFAEQLRTGRIAPADAWYAFTVSYSKSLGYPTPVTCISNDEWDEILQPLTGILLQKCGIASSFPRKILFTSHRLQGLGARHPYYQQELQHLELLCTETQNPVSPVGNLFTCNAEDLRLEAGVSGTFTSIPWERLTDVLTQDYLSDLFGFLRLHKIDLHDPIPLLSPQRVHDLTLMDVFLLGDHPTAVLRQAVAWRQYYQVTYVSDITSADGQLILPDFWHGRSVSRKTSDTRWPRAPPRRSLSVDTWQVLLRPLTRLGPSTTLRRPLGPWFKNPASTWKWLFSSDEDRIYHRLGHVWQTYRRDDSRVNRRLNSGRFSPLPGFSAQVPEGLSRADVTSYRHSTKVVLDSTSAPVLVAPLLPPTTLRQACRQLEPYVQWTVDKIIQSDEGAAVAQAILDGTALGISDGSYKNGRCTSAALIEGPSKSHGRVLAVNRVPGHSLSQTSYRGELGGILSLLTLVRGIITLHQITNGQIRLGLDGEQAMKEAAGKSPLVSSQQSFDLLTIIRRTVESLPIDVEFFWVEGHQMERHGKQDYNGTLNEICDGLAKIHWNEYSTTEVPLSPPNALGWTFSVDGVIASCFDMASLYDHTYGRQVSLPYWQDDRQPIPVESITSINWDAIAAASRCWPRGQRQWLAKHLTRFSPTGRNMFRRHEWSHDLCCRCFAPDEDSMHVICCPADTARAQWIVSVDLFLANLDKDCTSPAITMVMRSRIQTWMQGSEPRHYHSDELPRLVASALRDQDRIGWSNFMIGRLSDSWTDAQDQWLVQISTRWKRSSARWAKNTVQGIWDILLAMWLHRNSVLHHPQHPWKIAAIATTDEVIKDIWRIYVPTDFLARDHHLFSGSADFILQHYTIERKELWILSTRHARMRKSLFRTSSFGTERVLMHQWLNPPAAPAWQPPTPSSP